MQKHVVIVIEPNGVVREGLKQIIKSAGHEVRCCVASLAELRESGSFAPNSTVLLRFNGREPVSRSISEIKAIMSGAVIVLLGGIDNIQSATQAIRTGATVCLADGADAQVLFKAIELAQSGIATMSLFGAGDSERMADEDCAAAAGAQAQDVHAAPAVLAHSDTQHKHYQHPLFSPREAAILQLLREGAPNKHIARQLSLTESTVKVHLKSILRKIRVNNRTQAAVWAMSQPTIQGSDRYENSNGTVL